MGERTELTREVQAILALHDFGTRHGATAHSVRQAMLDEGFTLAEIAKAAKDYGRKEGE